MGHDFREDLFAPESCSTVNESCNAETNEWESNISDWGMID